MMIAITKPVIKSKDEIATSFAYGELLAMTGSRYGTPNNKQTKPFMSDIPSTLRQAQGDAGLDSRLCGNDI